MRRLLVLLGLLAALPVAERLMPKAAAQTTLRIGLSSDPDVLDPTLSRSVTARQVFAAMCDKLVDINARLEIVPQLATSWEWQEEGRALVLQLRPGVRFHDGTPLDAAAAVTGLERHLRTNGSTRRGEMGPIRSIEATGPMTLRISLTAPFAPLLAALSDRAGMLVSPRQATVTGNDFQREPACAGPYRLTRRIAQDRIDLEKFEGYWDAARIHADRVTYRPIPDATVRAANLRAGQLDIIERVQPTDVGELRRDARVHVLQGPSLSSFYIAVNIAHGPQANSPIGREQKVREAFDLAIDRQALNQVAFDGLYRPGNQSVPPDNPFYAASLPVPGRDLARARALLREAGYANTRVKVRMLVPNTTDYTQASEVIQAMVAEAGIDLEIQVTETATLLRQWTAGEFESLIIQWSGRTDIDANLWGFNACNEPLNGGRYCNPAADAALLEGRSSVDPARRRAAYGRAMQVLLHDRPYIYLWHSTNIAATGARVEGLQLVPDGLIRVAGVRVR